MIINNKHKNLIYDQYSPVNMKSHLKVEFKNI